METTREERAGSFAVVKPAGDIRRTLADLERRVTKAVSPVERATLADELAIEYVSRGEPQRALLVLEKIDELPDDPALRARLLSLRSWASAMCGEHSGDIDQALELASRADDERTLAQVTHRAGVVAYYLHDLRNATSFATQSMGIAESIGWDRQAAVATILLYSASYHLAGDLTSALFWLERAAVFALKAEDQGLWRYTIGMQYDIAAVTGKWDRARRLQELLRRKAEIERYTEGLPALVADSLLLASDHQYLGMLKRIESGMPSFDEPGDVVLLRGMKATALIALGEDARARVEARGAIALSRSRLGAQERGYRIWRRQIGRILGASVSISLGDVYDGRRALQAKMALGDGPPAALADAILRRKFDVDAPELAYVRGYALMFESARRAYEARGGALLTPLERELLTLLQTGAKYADIARELGRAPDTIREKASRVFEKLGARNRIEALDRAHRAGIV